ncbi:SH3 domain protein [Trypanosoma cruzi]|nr:SH3 domain protein [Trypanosoma cruzi]
MRGQSRFPWNDEGRKYRCDVSYVMLRVHKHLKAMYETRLEEVTRSADGRQETARGCLLLLMKADDGSPIHSTTSRYSAKTSHRTADAPPDISNCPTQSSRRAMELIRQRRSTVVRRSTDIRALGQPH